MNPEPLEDFKKAGIALVKNQTMKLDKYGAFIFLTWCIGEIFLYFIQASLIGDPLRKMVIVVCLLYAVLFPFVGVFVYAGLNALMNKYKE